MDEKSTATVTCFPGEFMKQWAIDHRVRLAALKAAGRSALRQQLLCDLKRAFPSISATHAGMLVGGLEHATVLYAWRKQGLAARKKRTNITPEIEATVREMWDAGATVREIMYELDLGHTTCYRIINQSFNARQREAKARHSRDNITRRLRAKIEARHKAEEKRR